MFAYSEKSASPKVNRSDNDSTESKLIVLEMCMSHNTLDHAPEELNSFSG